MLFEELYRVIIAGIETPKLLSSGLYSFAGAEAENSLGEETLMIVIPAAEGKTVDATLADPDTQDKVNAMQDEMKYQTRRETKKAVELAVFTSGILDGLSERFEAILQQFIKTWGTVSLKVEANEKTLPKVTVMMTVLCVLISEAINELSRLQGSESTPSALKTLLLHSKNSLSHLLDSLTRCRIEVYTGSLGEIRDE